MKRKLIAGILALALIATAFAVVSAQITNDDAAPRGQGGWFGAHGGLGQLTDDERQEMQQQMQQFRQTLAEQYGIDLTDEEREEMQNRFQEKQQEQQQEMEQFRQELAEQYGVDLTDAEREEMQQKMQQFRQELAEQYGISCPAGPQFAGEGGFGPRGPMGREMQGFQHGPGFGECPPTPPDLEE